MIRINLLPREEKAHAEVRVNLPPVGEMVAPVAVVVLVALTIGSIAMAQNMRIQSLTRSIASVEEQSRALAPQIARVNQLAQERAELDLRLGIISKLEKGRTTSVRVMDELARCLPEHLWLTAALQDESSLTLEGGAFSMLVVSDLISQLERSPMFAGVELEFIEQETVAERDVVEFRVACRVTPDENAP